MKRLSIIGILTAFSLCLGSCGDQVSKEFKAIEQEAHSIEKQIAETNDCDDLQMMHIAILGLRSDVDNIILDETISETETEQLQTIVDELEAFCNGKRASIDCDQIYSDGELDTSGDIDED